MVEKEQRSKAQYLMLTTNGIARIQSDLQYAKALSFMSLTTYLHLNVSVMSCHFLLFHKIILVGLEYVVDKYYRSMEVLITSTV